MVSSAPFASCCYANLLQHWGCLRCRQHSWGLLPPSSGGDGEDVDCVSQEGLCYQTVTPFLLLVGMMSQAIALCHHLVLQAQQHCVLLLDVFLRLCPDSSRTGDGGGHCHRCWCPSCELFVGMALHLQASLKLSLDFSLLFKRWPLQTMVLLSDALRLGNLPFITAASLSLCDYFGKWTVVIYVYVFYWWAWCSLSTSPWL